MTDNYNPYGSYGTEGRTDSPKTISVSSGYGSSASASFGQVASFEQSNTLAKIATVASARAAIEACNPTDGDASSLFDIYTRTDGTLGLTGSMFIQDGSTYSASLTGNDLSPTSTGNSAGWEFSGGFSARNPNATPGSYYLQIS